MNYASGSNIREVIKFYNLGDRSFETDFSFDFAGRLLPEATPILIPGERLSHLTYKLVHPRIEILPQKYRPHSAGPKNIEKGCGCLKICFTDKTFVSFDPELSDFENISY